jgi:hypothetical protein
LPTRQTMLTSSEGKNIMNREPSTNSGFKG